MPDDHPYVKETPLTFEEWNKAGKAPEVHRELVVKLCWNSREDAEGSSSDYETLKHVIQANFGDDLVVEELTYSHTASDISYWTEKS
jgi:hypothetical protein